MATQGKRIDDATKREIERRRKRDGLSIRRVAKEAGVAKSTVQKVLRERGGSE